MERVIDGIKVNYEVMGEGTPFIILHGWGSNSERWIDVAGPVSRHGFKVIVPDLPGFGKSQQLDKPWNPNNYVSFLEKFVDELGIDEFYLAGHSFGGALACKLAIKYPQQIKKLFLISTASVRKKTAKKSFMRGMAKIAKLFSFLPGYELFRKAFYKYIIRRSDYPYVSGAMKETYLNVVADDLSQFVAFIRVPTVIIWGEKDQSTPLEDAHWLNQKIKESKLEIIAGADHILNRKNPEQLVQKILDNI